MMINNTQKYVENKYNLKQQKKQKLNKQRHMFTDANTRLRLT